MVKVDRHAREEFVAGVKEPPHGEKELSRGITLLFFNRITLVLEDY